MDYTEIKHSLEVARGQLEPCNALEASKVNTILNRMILKLNEIIERPAKSFKYKSEFIEDLGNANETLSSYTAKTVKVYNESKGENASELIRILYAQTLILSVYLNFIINL